MCGRVENMIKTGFTTVLYIFQQQHREKKKNQNKTGMQYWARERLNVFASSS